MSSKEERTEKHDTHMISVRVPIDVLEELDRSAAQNRRDRSGEVLRALDLYLAAQRCTESQLVRILTEISQNIHCRIPDAIDQSNNPS